MSSGETYRMRPAGRHILTIGRDLIQDSHAAVMELVKNAYDADSPDVEILFRAQPDHDGYTLVIEDHGHGMSRDTVIHQWMVPSTPDKLNRQHSPGGRTLQGRKGVGRYAASVLGTDLMLETVTSQGEKTTLFVKWDAFEQAQYLDDVEIRIETTTVSEPAGTRLTMRGDSTLLADWHQKQFNKLHFELKKLTSPVSTAISDEQSHDNFCMKLEVSGFPEVDDVTETVQPYPVFDYFDYRVAGRINADGKGVLTYVSQKARNTTEEEITFDYDKPTGCGELVFDIRVYDREKEAIDVLISRGLNVGKREARNLLDKYNGIGVYRNGFRIRPLGDPEFDWLKLNEERVQNPSMRIGSNQAIGYVQIQSDELSGLVEKSARDGLRENTAFSQLKKITREVITKLETRRFDYRKKAGLSRSKRKLETQLDLLFSYDSLKKDIRSKLTSAGVDKQAADTIIEVIDRDAEARNRVADTLRQTVAVYQSQATLGKIINVILHEGRRPLNYFRNQIPNLHKRYDSFIKTSELKTLEKIISMVDGIGRNADMFVKLFGKLDPLAAGKPAARKPLKLRQMIQDALSVFDEEMKIQHIVAEVTGPDDFRWLSWPQDIYAVFTNLVDNSVYWISEKNTPQKKIMVDVVAEGDALLHIDYRDTGPGIEPDLIQREVIFEPQFSTKPSGTGLGLAIAGEAAARNNLELKAFAYEQGVWFRLQPIIEDKKDG